MSSSSGPERQDYPGLSIGGPDVTHDPAVLAGALDAVVVLSAGNDKANVYQISPQNMTDPWLKPVVVAAHDERRRPAQYPFGRGTNFGPTVDVMAAGGAVLVPSDTLSTANVLSLRSQQCPELMGVGSCLDGLRVPTSTSLYARNSGTSMAAPHVSGLAALVASCNPALRTMDVRHIVQAAARRRLSNDLYGNEAISGYGALALTGSPSVAITSPSRFQVVSTGSEIDIQATLDGPEIHSWRVYVANKAPAARTDYKLVARGKGPVSGTVAQWTATSPGEKSVKLLVRTRLPLDHPVSSTYACGDPRTPRRLRSRYLQAVQFFSVEGSVDPEQLIQRVTSGEDHYAAPSISGPRVVAEQRSALGMPARIFARRLDSGQPPGIVGALGSRQPSLDDANPDRMVWVDPRTGAGEVWLHDFTGGTSTQLTSNGRDKIGPRIAGNWVAFLERQADGKLQVALHDLGSGATSLLTAGETVLRLEMSGDWMLWRDDTQTSSVTARRLSTGQTSTVELDSFASCLDVSGDWMVVLTRDFSFFINFGRILVRNLATGQQIQVDGGELFPSAAVFGCPSISGTLVGYTRLVGSRLYPHYRDFTVAGPPTRITFDETTLAADVEVSGSRLVWQDSREGFADQIWTYRR